MSVFNLNVEANPSKASPAARPVNGVDDPCKREFGSRHGLNEREGGMHGGGYLLLVAAKRLLASHILDGRHEFHGDVVHWRDGGSGADAPAHQDIGSFLHR